MRAATLLIPGGAKPLELSVTPLPWSGAHDELLNNVNRWRGQMQLSATDSHGLVDCTREIKVGDAAMTIVDLRGRLQAGGVMAPFAQNAAIAAGEVAAAIGETTVMPPDHPPIAAQTASAAAPFKFNLPEGWQSLPVSGMRRAAFRIGGGAKEALVTVFDFPAGAGSMMGDPVANVNRWRGEVGLAPLDDAKVNSSLEPIDIDGDIAQLVVALPDPAEPQESKVERGTLAAMLTRGDVVWFFKLSGDRGLVAAERDNFVSFLKSVRFTGSGANDGN